MSEFQTQELVELPYQWRHAVVCKRSYAEISKVFDTSICCMSILSVCKTFKSRTPELSLFEALFTVSKLTTIFQLISTHQREVE